MGRSILAVVAGFVLWTILWLGTNSLLSIATPDSFREDGGTDSIVILSILIIASVICSVLGGYLTARVSQGNAARNVMILAVILLAVGLLVESTVWGLLPLWYHLLFLLLLIPATVMGGRLQSSAN